MINRLVESISKPNHLQLVGHLTLSMCWLKVEANVKYSCLFGNTARSTDRSKAIKRVKSCREAGYTIATRRCRMTVPNITSCVRVQRTIPWMDGFVLSPNVSCCSDASHATPYVTNSLTDPSAKYCSDAGCATRLIVRLNFDPSAKR